MPHRYPKLRMINIERIKNKYGSYEQFSNKLDSLLPYLSGNDKVLLEGINLYYSNLFDFDDIDMEDDVRELMILATDTLSRLKGLHVKDDVVDFLVNLITHNIEFVKGTSRLGGQAAG